MIFTKYIPYYKNNLKVALPIMITQAGQVTVQLADNIMVGHVGTNQLAGVAFANSIFLIGIVFCIGFTQGLTPHIGQKYGNGQFKIAGQLFQSSLVLNFLLCIAISTIMAIVGFFMGSMGQETEVLHYAKQYYNIMLISIIPGIMFFGIRQFSEGIGITKYAMYITLIANAINIFLNWVLIYGKLGAPVLGVEGAAISTLISRIVMLILFVYILFNIYPYKHYLKFFTKGRILVRQFKTILSTSLPLAGQTLTEVTAFSFSTIMVGWISAVSLAGHQIAQSLSNLSFMIAIGIGAGATIRVSHQYGAKKYLDAKLAGVSSIHLSMAIMGFFGLCFILLRNYIPMIYTSDPEVIRIASQILVLVALFQIFDALQLACIASLRALADVKIPFLLAVTSYYLICLPLGYFCGFILDWGVKGIWTGLVIGLFCAGLLFYNRFIKLINRIIKENA